MGQELQEFMSSGGKTLVAKQKFTAQSNEMVITCNRQKGGNPQLYSVTPELL
jgi:hypothetical protein